MDTETAFPHTTPAHTDPQAEAGRPPAVVPSPDDAGAAGPHEIPVGDDIVATNTRWSFGGATHQHFDSHVNKSIPLYLHGHELVGKLVEFFSRPGSTVIDVGCSTGTLLRAIANKPTSQDISLIGVDIEADMVRAARKTCAGLDNVTITQGNALSTDYSNASAVIMYYTLQFSPPHERPAVLERICRGLRKGGALMLFEKVLAPDSRLQDLIQQLYMEFKFDNGFDAAEIYNKTRSLRSVMAPQTSADTHTLLREIGFTSIVTVQKYLCFEGILAIK